MATYRHVIVRGRKIFYREAGSRDSHAVVLLHGFPSSSHMFRDLIPQLADRFHIIAPDYVGFGYSDAPVSVISNTPSTTWQHISRICCSTS